MIKRKSGDKNGPVTMERAAYSVINCNYAPYMGPMILPS